MSDATKYQDRLAGYIEVKERIRLFFEAHPDGRLVTADVRWPDPADDAPRIAVKALAYRTPDDPHPGAGWSWMNLPGTTPYTRGSELENTETSAWGRAIGSLGIGIANGIASAQEIRTKEQPEPKVEQTDNGGLIGTVEVGDKASSDFMLRQTPEGGALGFRLRGGRGGILVECRGPLAEQLVAHRDALIGQRVTVWGAISDRSFMPKGKTQEVVYQVLAADRLHSAVVGDLPSDATPDVPEPTGAESGGLSAAEQAELEQLAF